MALDGVFSNCTKLFPCPVCRATDRCSVIKARGIVNCRNPEANEGEARTAKDGSLYWTHHMGRAAAAQLVTVPEGPPVAEPQELHKVYTALLLILGKYGPSPRHRKNLGARGLDEAAVESGWYRTVPSGELRAQIAAQLVTLFTEELCRKVPGFIQSEQGWTLAGVAGMFVPVRNVKDQIVSLKIRLDEPLDDGSRYLTFSSASAGGPGAYKAVHFPAGRRVECRRVRITEGELKADVAQRVSGVNTVSLPGVGAWRMAAAALRALDQDGPAENPECRVKTGVVCFDSDRKVKRAVAMCQAEMVTSLREAGFAVEIEVWPDVGGKGIDDLLLKGLQPEVLQGEAVDEHVKECLKACGVKTIREEIDEMVRAIEEQGSLLAVTEDDERLTLVAEVHADAPREYTWLREQVNGLGLKSWETGLLRCLKAHLAERRAVESEAIVKNEDADALPTIETYDRHIRDVVQDAVGALVDANDPPSLFHQGGSIVHLRAEGETMRPGELSRAEMLTYLDKRANWLWSKGKRPEFVPCPDRVAQHLLADRQESRAFPEVRGIVQTPCFDREGNLICEPGFHPPSGLFYHPRGELAIDFHPNRLPSEQEFRHAKNWIEQYMFQTMPFAGRGAHAFAWSLYLVPFVREMIDGPTPLHVINAPKEGTGKGLLNFICTQPFVPGGVMPTNEIKNNEEWAKSLLSLLKRGESHLYIDNVNFTVDSGVLALCLTERGYAARQLGTNNIWSVPIRQVWSLSGNNVQLSSEIARRSVWGDLDANVEDPSKLDYGGFPIRTFLKNNRSSAVAHALTCVRWWLAHDCPAWGGRAPGSYERWAEVMGGILQTCEVDGFLEGQRDTGEEQSQEAMGWRAFVSEWWQRFGDQELKARELVEIAQTLPFWEEVESSRSPAQSFGRRLEKKRNAVYLGKKIVARVVHHQSAYRLAVVSEADHQVDLRERRGG